jgi:S-adenosylmethionine synthetase
MIEKVNPSHPDKVADRIAGALVDLAYKKHNNPKIAVEVLIGHGECHAIIETDADIWPSEVDGIIEQEEQEGEK